MLFDQLTVESGELGDGGFESDDLLHKVHGLHLLWLVLRLRRDWGDCHWRTTLFDEPVGDLG